VRRGRSTRWIEAGLLLVSFGALSLYGIVSLEARAVQSRRGRELDELVRRDVRPARSVLREGALVGRLEVPRLGMSVMVLEGVSADTLRVAAGHVPETALPGNAGNTAIAAHRDTFFRGLGDIREGDGVVVTTPAGAVRYRVSSAQVVRPEDVHVLDATENETLTLVTCYPFQYIGSAPKRFIVRAHRSRPGE
jgi:sortase A